MAMIMLIMMLKYKIIVISLGNIKGSAHSDCNIDLKFIRKIRIVFHNLKKIILMQELGKFNLERNGMPNGLEK